MQINPAALSATEVQAQQLWSHSVLTSMQQQQSQIQKTQLSVSSLSFASISPTQQKIAVLAVATDQLMGTENVGGNCDHAVLGLQLLSVSCSDAPVVMGTYKVDVTSSREQADSSRRWRCCYSKYGEVLLHREKGNAHVWRLNESELLRIVAGTHE